jgi:hypothetical protein
MIMDLPRTVNPETEQNSSSQHSIRFRAAGKGALISLMKIPVDCSFWERLKSVVDNLAPAG